MYLLVCCGPGKEEKAHGERRSYGKKRLSYATVEELASDSCFRLVIPNHACGTVPSKSFDDSTNEAKKIFKR